MELTTRRTSIGGRGAPLQNGIRFESYHCNNRSNSPTDYNSNTKLLPLFIYLGCYQNQQVVGTYRMDQIFVTHVYTS